MAWMTDADIPFSELDRPSFRRFIAHGKFATDIPCAKTARTTILDQEYESIKSTVIASLKDALGISATTDIWTKRESTASWA